MAAVSPSQPISTITPPSSSHGGQIPWDYAVPIDDNEVCPNGYLMAEVGFLYETLACEPRFWSSHLL